MEDIDGLYDNSHTEPPNPGGSMDPPDEPEPDPVVDEDERIADYEGEWTGFGDVPGFDGYPATDCWGEPLPEQPEDQRRAQHQRVQASPQRAVEVHERHPQAPPPEIDIPAEDDIPPF
jgi:hypothetical protein